MSPRSPQRGRMIPALVACFYAGGVAGWLLHATFMPKPVPAPPPAAATRDAVATTGSARPKVEDPHAAPPIANLPSVSSNAVGELRSRQLRWPIDGADLDAVKGMFAERREGIRDHEAVDILAPRNTPVHAVEDGQIAKLFQSRAGGTTVYQFDPSARFCYYYAHLERYADGLREGQRVSKGDVIGYVGTSGNAPPNTPHLHFAIFELTIERRWWDGTPLDPYRVFSQ